MIITVLSQKKIIDLGSLLLTWFNFNPSMDKNYNHYKVWDDITDRFLNFNGATHHTLDCACDNLSNIHDGIKINPC